jgi:putative addiction module component (TIGR02574 family)
MDAVDIRKELHEVIEEADEKLLKAIHTVLLTEDKMDDFEISEEHKRILDERLKAYHENPSDVLTWSEIKERYRKK